MTLKTFLYPALYVMNKLSFKVKIIVSISILFILLLFPSRTIFMNYVEQSNTYNKQLIGLEYIEIINSFIKTVQIHRSLSKDFLNGNKTLIEDIIEKEKKFYKQKHTLMDYDAVHLKILKSNQNFAKAIALFEVIKIDKLDSTIPYTKNFKTHGKIVDKLIKTILDISEITTFSASKDLRINYLADMLGEKLLRLYEFTRQLQDSSSSLLSSKYVLKEQKKILFSLATDLTSLKLNLKENQLLRQLPNYHLLEGESTTAIYKLENLLDVIDDNILGNKESTFNSQSFLQKTIEAIESQDNLYKMFNYTYKDTTEALKLEVNKELWSLLMVFLSILMVAFYIFIAFYQSITGNLKKLQTASELISSGQTKIKLKVDKQDEIGDALLAFNTMSAKLDENISFLDGYKTAIDNSSIVSKTDLRGIITYVNKMFCDVSGYSRSELMGRSHNIVRHPDMPKEAFKDMWKTIRAKKIWKGVIKNRTKDGNAYIVNATVLPILNRDGEIIEYVAVRHNITELEESKDEIKKQRTDLLTGLPNRNQLLVDLKKAIKPVIFYLNIDDFSGFNDFYGSIIGDNVLLNLSKTLENIKSEKHFKLYKLQADQFILLFQEDHLAKNNFQHFFENLVKYIETKISDINLENQSRISITITSGAATYYAHDNYQKLILYSNIARKKAQAEHKKFLLFNHNMRKNENYAQNMEWIRKIKEAIDEDRVVTHYQPIVENKTGKISKYETLVRMVDRDGDIVSTQTFLEIAHRAKFYPQITKIVIDKAFKTFENRPEYGFSLNLTVEDILSEETSSYIYKKLATYPNSHNVVFEIVESEEINDYKIINDFIKSIKKYGVKIAIDDFGSGYANFEHIISIDSDFIKIDGSLIKNLTTDKNARIITEAIISFSKKLGRKTITEYVHNEEVYQIVKDLGADYSQGFYFGSPSTELK